MTVSQRWKKRLLILTFPWAFALLLAWPAAPATAADDDELHAAGSVGVIVDPTTTTTTTIAPTTTTEPPTTIPPTTTTTVPPTTVAPTTTTTAAPVPAVTTTLPPTTTTEPLSAQLPPPPAESKSIVSHVKEGVQSAARTTNKFVSGVLSGKPVADVAQKVLPKDVAVVVVPAVRTASTFVFPIGLAGSVIAFLVLQQRIDSGDPKLAAAPLAHDDDVVTFS